ncbi:threonine/homoserine/homoserine lactone efflux protein [Caballeronia udeis]|uniref:Threonine/homoserine/homoserine lactone efflux protein n=1 Tax=Caballeronia udeis TaxID=1232866 RepID=A0ABW8MLL3_9BURK
MQASPLKNPAGPKAYIITGRTSGMGRLAALELASHGVVVLVGRDRQKLEEVRQTIEEGGRRAVSVLCGAGMAVTLGNPKLMVFYIALLPSLIDLSSAGFQEWAILSCVTLVTLVTLATIDLSWTFLAHKARLLLRTPRAVRIANRVGAFALGGAAAAIASRN